MRGPVIACTNGCGSPTVVPGRHHPQARCVRTPRRTISTLQLSQSASPRRKASRATGRFGSWEWTRNTRSPPLRQPRRSLLAWSISGRSRRPSPAPRCSPERNLASLQRATPETRKANALLGSPSWIARRQVPGSPAFAPFQRQTPSAPIHPCRAMVDPARPGSRTPGGALSPARGFKAAGARPLQIRPRSAARSPSSTQEATGSGKEGQVVRRPKTALPLSARRRNHAGLAEAASKGNDPRRWTPVRPDPNAQVVAASSGDRRHLAALHPGQTLSRTLSSAGPLPGW